MCLLHLKLTQFKLDKHALRSLSDTSYLRKRSVDAPSQLAFPSVSLNHGDISRHVKSSLDRVCKGRLQVITMQAPSVDSRGTSQESR